MRRLFVAVGLFGLAACTPQPAPVVATPHLYTIATPFDEDALAPWQGDGPATLHGQAFLKTVGGEVRTCAGEKVFLAPDTPYGYEFISAVLSHGYEGYANLDPRFRKYAKTTMCDAEGKFAVTKLADRSWIVLTAVVWRVPTVGRQGGDLSTTVTLSPGDNDLIMSEGDRR